MIEGKLEVACFSGMGKNPEKAGFEVLLLFWNSSDRRFLSR